MFLVVIDMHALVIRSWLGKFSQGLQLLVAGEPNIVREVHLHEWPADEAASHIDYGQRMAFIVGGRTRNSVGRFKANRDSCPG